MDLALVGKKLGVDKTLKFEVELIKEIQTAGNIGCLTHLITKLVVEKNYHRAIKEIDDYIGVRSELPMLDFRTNRYSQRCKNLITAIERQRSIVGIDQLAVSKQQEIYEGVRSYIRLLKKQLKNIEGVEFSLRVEDVRSTVWVLRSLTYCVGSIVLLDFLLEAAGGYHETLIIVASDFFDRLAHWTVGLFL